MDAELIRRWNETVGEKVPIFIILPHYSNW